MKSRIESDNFKISVLTLILMVPGFLGIATGIDPETVWWAIDAKDIGYLTTVLLPSLVNMVFKLIQKFKEEDWNFKQVINIIKGSKNFWVQLLTVVLTGIAIAGVAFPAEASTEVIDAVESKDVTLILTAIIVNIVNPIIHYFIDKDREKKALEEVKVAVD